jgi:hypothetical protein
VFDVTPTDNLQYHGVSVDTENIPLWDHFPHHVILSDHFPHHVTLSDHFPHHVTLNDHFQNQNQFVDTGNIILIELMYIVLVPFDWTRALSPVCFLFVHNSMNFCVFYLFITRWTFFCLTSINNMATDDGNYDSVRLKAIFTIIHKNN